MYIIYILQGFSEDTRQHKHYPATCLVLKILDDQYMAVLKKGEYAYSFGYRCNLYYKQKHKTASDYRYCSFLMHVPKIF